jgi:hypothetical protein
MKEAPIAPKQLQKPEGKTGKRNREEKEIEEAHRERDLSICKK